MQEVCGDVAVRQLQTDRQTDRQTNRQKDRQTDRQTDRKNIDIKTASYRQTLYPGRVYLQMTHPTCTNSCADKAVRQLELYTQTDKETD